jgi:hypothetical protein
MVDFNQWLIRARGVARYALSGNAPNWHVHFAKNPPIVLKRS